MKRSEIKVGRLYENESGLGVREVIRIHESRGSKKNRTIVEYLVIKGRRPNNDETYCTLTSFARWAFSEVDQ